MSDMTFPGHTLACDWPECEETAHDGHYSGWESYDSAVMAFADPDNGGEWLHKDGHDYCPKHWHLDRSAGRFQDQIRKIQNILRSKYENH